MSRFYDLFQRKPVIGMLHLGGNFPVLQAMDDYSIYVNNGLDGVIVENYHGSVEDVEQTLAEINRRCRNIKIGINILGDFKKSFELADEFKADFIQIDSVQPPEIDRNGLDYGICRIKYPHIVVLGGVGFKGTTEPASNLRYWLGLARSKVDAVVTTGPGTGKETPLEKVVLYKKLLDGFPVVEGAGSDSSNVYEHFRIVDGIIIGSFLKPKKNTQLSVDEDLAEEYMIEANRARI